MKLFTLFATRLSSTATMSAILALLLAFSPARARAQVAGNNAVYSSSTCCAPSSAFIDASVLTAPNGAGATSICAKINDALSIAPTIGAVIDARGVTNLTCLSGTPWVQGSNVFYTPAMILLPAGVIKIPTTWIVPTRTRIIGEGSGASGSNVTTIQAESGFTDPDSTTGSGGTGGPSIIRMGSTTYSQYKCSASPCFAVGVEDLVVDGQGQALNGITNVASEELSYVNRVSLYQVMGTGLQIGWSGTPLALNSGPYSNIRFETGSTYSPSATTTCAQIVGSQPTRGIHGLSCISNNTPNVAIYLDSSSNSIEDVTIQGFGEGVRVGQNGQAAGNVLLNISAPSASLWVNPVVHICGPTNVTGNPCSAYSSVTDLSVVGTSSGCLLPSCNTLADDVTGTKLPHGSLAIYVLGEAVGSGYSRFTTSESVPTWIVGSSTPGSSCSSTSTGSLYSNTTGTSGGNDTLYVCTGTTWSPVK